MSKTREDYEADLASAQEAVEVLLWANMHQNPNRNNFRGDWQRARSKVSRLYHKIASFDPLPEHTDIFGCVFAVGQRVMHSSASRYAGGELGYVTKINRSTITVAKYVCKGAVPTGGSAIRPDNIIVVDLLVDAQEKRHG